jgi:uncharacterized membrane protein YkvA (DUF1232 family)
VSSYAQPDPPLGAHVRDEPRRPRGRADRPGRPERPVRGAPRRGAKRTLMATIRQLPQYLRMFFGLFRDPRVATVDKVLVGAAIAYLLAPVDLIADWIPFLGQVDDVFLLVGALKRLIANAGRRVVADHWDGDPRELSSMELDRVIAAAAFFLPGRIKRRLRMIGRV